MFFWGLFRVSTKLVATATLSIGLIIVGFLFAPNVLSAVYDFADLIEEWLPTAKDINLDGLGGALYRQVVNDTMVFGVLMTLIARIFVELIWGAAALAFGRRSDPDGTPVVGSGGYFDA